MKKAELEVERIEQKLLLRLAQGMPESKLAARVLAKANLIAYFNAAGVDFQPWLREIERLIDLVLGEKDNNVFYISSGE